jgi:hypothetical protein
LVVSVLAEQSKPITIWILGSHHLNADKCISWSELFPNFSNCDLLIVNLSTLNKEIIQKNEQKLFNEGRRHIFDLLMTGEKQIIFILSNEQKTLDWLPIAPILRKIQFSEINEYTTYPDLEDYMSKVRKCDFYIKDYVVSKYFDSMVNPGSADCENYKFTEDIRGQLDYKIIRKNEVLNKANQNVGVSITCIITDTYEIIARNYKTEKRHYTGEMIFLPPPTDISVDQGIDLILNNILGINLKESPPIWEKSITLPSLTTIEQEINQKMDQKEKIVKEIQKLEKEKTDKIFYRRLLWTIGPPLEDVVKEAFVFLGFPEIRKIRANNLEDWIIELKTTSNYQYGIIEVKGSNKRTSQNDLVQCNKWVEDYVLLSKKVKGIFVPNQCRLDDISTSINAKMHFEPNELDYAKTRNICILPSHEIFNAVAAKMKDSNCVDRASIEKIILSSNGICKLV